MNRNIESFEYVFPARVLDDGKVTIPKTVREKLGIKKGDLVTLIIRVFPQEVKSRNE